MQFSTRVWVVDHFLNQRLDSHLLEQKRLKNTYIMYFPYSKWNKSSWHIRLKAYSHTGVIIKAQIYGTSVQKIPHVKHEHWVPHRSLQFCVPILHLMKKKSRFVTWEKFNLERRRFCTTVSSPGNTPPLGWFPWKEMVVKVKAKFLTAAAEAQELKTLLQRTGGGTEGEQRVGGEERRRATPMASMLTQETCEWRH